LIDGPRIAPRSGTAKQLVVFLHGYGANGDDLISLGREWQGLLPDAAFVSPNAPEGVPGYPAGRQWFGLTFRDPDERWRGVTKARPVLDEFLDAELQKNNLSPSALALVGFSQGTMMALHTGLRRSALAAIVGYSGVLVTPTNQDALAKVAEEIKAKPPVLLVHGNQDEVIPAQALLMSAQGLGGLGVAVEWHLSQGIGHGIDSDGLKLGGAFLHKAFRGR
jgi:phospholipase/carboxylesterase